MKKQSQNKANFLDAQMNVSSVYTKYYENVSLRRRGQNKPNQTQFFSYPKPPDCRPKKISQFLRNFEPPFVFNR